MQNNDFITRKSLSMLFKNKTSVFSALVRGEKGRLEFCFPLPVIKRGKGQFIYDYDGNRYIDFFLSNGDLLIGHSHPQLTKVLKGWLGRGYAPGYLQVGLEMLANKLENTFFNNSKNKEQRNRKWFFFPSYESLIFFLPALLDIFNSDFREIFYFSSDTAYKTKIKDLPKIGAHQCGAIGNEKNLFFKGSNYREYTISLFLKKFKVISGSESSTDKSSVDESRVSEIEYIRNSLCLIELNPSMNADFLIKTLNTLKKNGNFVLSIEKDFSSYLFLNEHRKLLAFIDGRILGSWMASGLPITAIYFSNFIGLATSGITENSVVESIGAGIWVPPLFIIKGTIRAINLFNKLGGVERYIQKLSHLYSFLDDRWFKYNSGSIFIAANQWIIDNWKDIYFLLLNKGIFLSPSIVHPLYISLVHEDEALKKYAKKINSIFMEYSR